MRWPFCLPHFSLSLSCAVLLFTHAPEERCSRQVRNAKGRRVNGERGHGKSSLCALRSIDMNYSVSTRLRTDQRASALFYRPKSCLAKVARRKRRTTCDHRRFRHPYDSHNKIESARCCLKFCARAAAPYERYAAPLASHYLQIFAGNRGDVTTMEYRYDGGDIR